MLVLNLNERDVQISVHFFLSDVKYSLKNWILASRWREVITEFSLLLLQVYHISCLIIVYLKLMLSQLTRNM